jgi:hypothetical protein
MSGNALPEDYEELWRQEELKSKNKKEIKCVCVCGRERILEVDKDNEDLTQITNYPCKCGLFMCVVGTKPGLHTPIDLMWEN